ncbi:MAG: ATP-binding cassette domain-containing protein [Robiginitomaculum sp.]
MLEQAETILSLSDISKSFAGKRAVHNISFQVKKGQIVGFLGPNGSGKTTTLRMALGLIDPDMGKVSLFGNPPGERAFGRVGFLPEERGLYRKITAREAIAYIAQLNGLGRKEAYRRADAMLDRYGLGDAKRKKIKQMSKGMAQKVQLIAAIAHDPEFLILDEPFSGLDPVNQKLLEDMVREIADKGRTIVFSTHVMEHAERLCDKIILMSSGKKIFDGNTEKALAAAPQSLTVETKTKGAEYVLRSVSKVFSNPREYVYKMVLKDGLVQRDVLQACERNKVSLLLFEPEKPSLHEAFVALVSQDTPNENSSVRVV